MKTLSALVCAMTLALTFVTTGRAKEAYEVKTENSIQTVTIYSNFMCLTYVRDLNAVPPICVLHISEQGRLSGATTVPCENLTKYFPGS